MTTDALQTNTLFTMASFGDSKSFSFVDMLFSSWYLWRCILLASRLAKELFLSPNPHKSCLWARSSTALLWHAKNALLILQLILLIPHSHCTMTYLRILILQLKPSQWLPSTLNMTFTITYYLHLEKKMRQKAGMLAPNHKRQLINLQFFVK